MRTDSFNGKPAHLLHSPLQKNLMLAFGLCPSVGSWCPSIPMCDLAAAGCCVLTLVTPGKDVHATSRAVSRSISHGPSPVVFDSKSVTSPQCLCSTVAASAQIFNVLTLLQERYGQQGVVPEAQRKASLFLIPQELHQSYLSLSQHSSGRVCVWMTILLCPISVQAAENCKSPVTNTPCQQL